MLRTLRAASESGAPDSDVRAYVTIGAALCCLYLGEAEEARQLIAEGVAARRRLGDPNGIADALFNQGAVLGETGDMEGAERALEEGLTWCPPGTRTYTGLVVNLGITRFYRGDYARAEKPLTEALELNRAAGIRQGEAIAQMYLGSVALYTRHDLDAARGRYRDALRLFQELNHRRGVATALFCFAELATVAGEWNNGARLYGAHDARLAAVGSALTEASRPAYERDMAVLRAHLGEGFSAAYAAGQALGEEGAVTLALTALQGNGDVAA